jgi:SAM-dependent methyltransferase
MEKKQHWEASYGRQENFCFHPNEETIKFLNRFVCKKTGPDTFEKRLPGSGPMTALDVGCGIGANVHLFNSYGISTTGCDISETAIAVAQNIYPNEKYIVTDGSSLPFEDESFDVVMANSSLDSMTNELCNAVFSEMCRVSKSLLYCSFIRGDEIGDIHATQDIVCDAEHENGTAQGYFTFEKISQMASSNNLIIVKCDLDIKNVICGSTGTIKNCNTYGRYHVTFKNK